MKNIWAGLLAISAAGLIGCNNQSTPGGPGASSPSTSGRTPAGITVGQAEETFRLDVPNLSTRLTQGEVQQVSIAIKRGKNFSEDVVLTFGELPKGVTVEPGQPMLKAGDEEAKFKVKAADDAALGDHTIKVTGTPTKGKDAANEFKITVNKK